ncbi:PAS domain-containing protein [Mesorhizobium sp. B2-1-8]|uniref:blue-light-activated histidine kinase n=1 Tax=unclassified Mesorhizobium TaxID=325217 RepID=UPI001127468D|nr:MULTISPECIES: PAS domain-containing protein [unclassified Mesorhizobium]MBZ9673731.1 PAS domain-containing protein [Mesorhizobium sp. ES1-3]UCI18398.1 PAS domain-containing protein [Mesorhizobium sp. B2-1-8]
MDNEGTSGLHGDAPAAVTDRAMPDLKELAAIAFQRTRMPIVVTDATQKDFPIVLANQSFLNLTGYKANEVLGRNCRFLQGAATAPAAIAEIRAGLREDRAVNVELLNYRKDGSAFWNQLHLSPIHDDDGRLVYHFASQIDRTDYRRIESLEASEHRLLLEVDHRANNVLALVDSIVRLTISDDAALYAASVQRRIQALARAHGLLSKRAWHEIPLRETISSQIEPYGAARALLAGPEVLLAAHSVQPLALFIHELAVNAASHGSLSKETGQVQISWQLSPQNHGFVLVWEETGGPPPLTARRKGFGTLMTEATIRRQLQGSLRREWSDQGVRIVAEVPNVTVSR